MYKFHLDCSVAKTISRFRMSFSRPLDFPVEFLFPSARQWNEIFREYRDVSRETERKTTKGRRMKRGEIERGDM